MMDFAPDFIDKADRCRHCHRPLGGAPTVGVLGWGDVCRACVEDMRANAQAMRAGDDLIGDLIALEIQRRTETT